MSSMFNNVQHLQAWLLMEYLLPQKPNPLAAAQSLVDDIVVQAERQQGVKVVQIGDLAPRLKKLLGQQTTCRQNDFLVSPYVRSG